MITPVPRPSSTPSSSAGATRYTWTTNGSCARTPCAGSCRTPQPARAAAIGHPRGGRVRARPRPPGLRAPSSPVSLQPDPTSPVRLDPAPVSPRSLRQAPHSWISPRSLRQAPHSWNRTPRWRCLKRRRSLKRLPAPYSRPTKTTLRPAPNSPPRTSSQLPWCQLPSARQSLLASPGILLSGALHLAEGSSGWPSMPLAVQQPLASDGACLTPRGRLLDLHLRTLDNSFLIKKKSCSSPSP